MIRTAIFSGSFNPIHTGHLILANYICQYEAVDEVWFIVSPQNPLKSLHTLLDDQSRISMVKLAIANNPKFHYCDIEQQLPKPSYTIDTLTALSQRYGTERSFSLIIGADNWAILDKWRDYNKIVDHYHLIVYPRLGYPLERRKEIDETHVSFTPAPIVEISSTFIREGIAQGREMNYFTPETVHKYIVEHNLYK